MFNFDYLINIFAGSNNIGERYTLNSIMSFVLDMDEIARQVKCKLIMIPLFFDNDNEYRQNRMRSLRSLNPDIRSKKTLLILESWHVRDGIDLFEVKDIFPNSTIVILSWDDKYYLQNCFYNEPEIMPGMSNVDFYLTNDLYSYNMYKNLGINSQFYISTPSESLLNMCVDNYNKYIQSKTYDVQYLTGGKGKEKKISNYRQKLIDILDKYFNTFYGNVDFNKFNKQVYISDQIYNSLMDYKAKINIGSTNSAWSFTRSNPKGSAYYLINREKKINQRCQKGVKDFISPFLETLLLIDDYDDYIKFLPNSVFPKYRFNHLDSLIELINHFLNHKEEFKDTINKQKNFIIEHSFLRQFMYIMKHNKSLLLE